MYIVIGQESHPDHFLEDQAYGPFDTYEEADAFANEKSKSDKNQATFLGAKLHFLNIKKYSYSVIELMKS
jgi:hypothetical protein